MKTCLVFVQGKIQGVGFRPFVSNFAKSLNLSGYVKNNGIGVEILLQGSRIEEFLDSFLANAPKISKIEKIQTTYCIKDEFVDFKILDSSCESEILVPPIVDLKICDDCQSEIFDKKSRRFFYPLINCTNCGPRHSVIFGFPYDREKTSMRKFRMCQECQEEYTNPKSRFFHAQPISCPKCGPEVYFNDIKIEDFREAFEDIASLIKAGEIVAIEGIGGFHLVCDGSNSVAVASLRDLKKRPTKPLALMCKDIQMASEIVNLDRGGISQEILSSKEAPIVLLEAKKNLEGVAPNTNRYGVMLAYTPIYKLLFLFLDVPLVVTSANRKGEPIVYKPNKMDFVKNILWHKREISYPIEDSIVQVCSGQKMTIRDARGYAPKYFRTKERVSSPILAMGANQKASFAFAFEDLIVLCPYIGDLDNVESIERFRDLLSYFCGLYGIEFSRVICDSHPNYESTKIAYEIDKNPTLLQHHYAHMLSVCFEYKIKNKVLGFCFDGTGYGSDGNIWGGEVLLGDCENFERILHFKNFRLLGGERALKDISRNFLAMLFDCLSKDEVFCFAQKMGKSLEELEALYLINQKGLNSPLTSSVGRIFDGIAWVCGLVEQSYEGESGAFVEALYDNDVIDFYGFIVGDCEIELSMREIVDDVNSGSSPSKIASKFINTLVEVVMSIGLNQDRDIVLCGGVFCNSVLTSKLLDGFAKFGKNCYVGSEIPPNDNGIAIGQLHYLMQRSKK